ncbi:hypothetical protein CAPTEDRAFT_203936 [Capitella teleta]|uniref:DUF4806 domain-containing protein n=1 Tax=Capitella teleta TaxID=283909 RepID=R7V0L7_CAPTE|nr:hypothetical protein CAPTEDRAFT_203936 [Capitella teleta]|eukprot:ELU09221.1 hypothetical protein CAPTEDRAFT_203936 [Capitella teleta]
MLTSLFKIEDEFHDLQDRLVLWRRLLVRQWGFQRRVLFLLVSIQKKLDETGRHLEPAESPFHLKQCADQIDFMELEAQLKDETNRRAVIAQLQNIGGADPKDAVRKILKRMMSNQLMASMNLKGKDSKSAFDSTLLFAVLKEAVIKRHDVMETDILMVTASCLKNAPDRSGGGGRHK